MNNESEESAADVTAEVAVASDGATTLFVADFNDTTFTHSGNTSRFFKKDGKYFVHTDGPDGKMADFEIKYTYGIEPLQQYLVEFSGGKIQALTICWDDRPKEDGGQRWYHR